MAERGQEAIVVVRLAIIGSAFKYAEGLRIGGGSLEN
jgi:hypothetical protein